MTTATATTRRTPAEDISPDNFHKLTASTYTHSMGRWKQIHFTESGAARLVHTIGLLEGIHLANPERAYALANKLCRYLDHLNDYGGPLESPEGRTDREGKPLQFPSFRISLGDDGGLGSFSILWMAAIPHQKYMERAAQIADGIALERFQTTFDEIAGSEDRHSVWDAALDKTTQTLRINKELTETRHYRPSWDTDGTFGYDRESVHYGFCFNGALVFHYSKDDILNGHWSSHT